MVPALIGRGREFGALRELLAGHASGTAFVLVQGDFGSGKSTLLRALVTEARRDGLTVLMAWADALESEVRFAVVRQLFEGSGVRTKAEDPGSPGDEAATLSELYGRVEDLAARGRVVIAVDDLQWADSSSLEWLRYLMRRADSLPLTVIAALGPGEAAEEDALGGALALLRDQVHLTPLDEEAVHSLMGEALGEVPDRSFSRACRLITGGNPYLLEAFLRALRTKGATADESEVAGIVQDVLPEIGPAVHALVRTLGADAEATAQAVAVLGGTQPVELIAGVTALPEPSVEDAVHALVRAGLLTRYEIGVASACPLLGAAVAHTVLPSRRQDFHARAAHLLLGRAAAPEDVAAHLVRGPVGHDWAPEALRRAAVAAADRGAPDSAVVYLRRALKEPVDERDRASLLALLGEAELDSSVPTAVRELRRGLHLSETPQERTAAARRLAGALAALDRFPDALEVLGRTSEAIRPVDPFFALRLEIDFLFASLCEAASAARAHPRLMALEMSDAQGTAVERPLAALLSLRAAMVGESPEEVVELARLALSRGMTPVDDESVVYNCAVLGLGAAGRPELALGYADSAVEEARARGSAFHYAHAISTRANANCRLGRLQECQADAEAALEALQEIDVELRNSHSVFPVATLAESLIRQGKTGDAESLLARGGLGGVLNAHWINDYVLLVRGWLRIEQGRLEESLADFLLCGLRTATRHMPSPGFYPWRSEAALVHSMLGQSEQARALAEEELTLARQWGVPEMIGVALRALGVVTGGHEGLRLLGESVEVLEKTPARFRYTQALADLGALSIACGKPAEGRGQLQEAVSAAHACGAGVVAEQALGELRALGDRPRTRTFHGVDALTPTERRVAGLAADGMTNREIAQHLFVGLRTVEVHLTNTYGKLGIEGRQGLAQALC
ncbi:helix-turn-helix transcriptional regulator [Wenjunlia tyrosinilytica]|uniref:HTH luxR-type domain-containing protein n=1 Tax=Wenjunlia tyrosinilytica TaxID=1544741 RepID=A0A917ZUB0_9ACTN|nr:AAA family ATPase [Wenjunlia tyrosinilytica]GGO90512.1 hypothetical protein GCM10012280_36200 [Wenjunlia tyrosinilytica]